MKKYLRLFLEIVLGLLLVAAGAFGYMNFSGKKHISHELTEVVESLDEAKEELAKTSEELHEAEAREEDRIARSGGAPAEFVPIYWHGSIPVGLFAIIVFNVSGSRK